MNQQYELPENHPSRNLGGRPPAVKRAPAPPPAVKPPTATETSEPDLETRTGRSKDTLVEMVLAFSLSGMEIEEYAGIVKMDPDLLAEVVTQHYEDAEKLAEERGLDDEEEEESLEVPSPDLDELQKRNEELEQELARLRESTLTPGIVLRGLWNWLKSDRRVRATGWAVTGVVVAGLFSGGLSHGTLMVLVGGTPWLLSAAKKLVPVDQQSGS